MDIREQFEQEFTRLVYNLKAINERWITIHPHGEDSEDYRRLKIEDGETPKEAIERVYKKGKTKTQKNNIKTFVTAANKTDAFNETNNYIVNITPPMVSISLDNINKINEGLHFVYNNVCKFEKIKDIKKSRMSALAAANYQHLVIGSMFNFDETKSKEEFDKEVTNWQKDNQKAIDLLKNNSALSRKEKNRLQTYEENIKYKRFGVYSSPENLIKETIIHELGHTISGQAIIKDREDGGKITVGYGEPHYKLTAYETETSTLIRTTLNKARKNGDIYKISKYANTNTDEFFAESFLMYNIGEKMPDYIRDMVEKIIKKI